MPYIIVYGTKECGCSRTACKVLEDHELSFEFVNLNNTPPLEGMDVSKTPVVVVDGRIRFRGEIKPVLLKRLLRGFA